MGFPRSGALTGEHGPTAEQLVEQVADALVFFRDTCARLEVAEPFAERFHDLLGRWNELHDAAGWWRDVARRVSEATGRAAGQFGVVDAAWSGADAALDELRSLCGAGDDLVETMLALAEVLDHTAESLRSIATDLAELINASADALAETVAVPESGSLRAREHLGELDVASREIHESGVDVLRAFVEFCAGIAPAEVEDAGTGSAAGIESVGQDGIALTNAASAEDAASAESGVDSAGPVVAGGVVGAMPPMGLLPGAVGGAGSRGRRRKSRGGAGSRELFGAPPEAAPPIIGERPGGQR